MRKKNKMKMRNRILSVLLCVLMVTGLVPVMPEMMQAQAVENTDYVISEDGKTYTVYTEEGLLAWNAAAQNDLTLNLVLGADIVLPDTESASNWTPLGDDQTDYTGTIDGRGYSISNLKIEGYGFLGFIGSAKDSTIKNLTIKDCSIIGGQRGYVGGIIGYAYNCTISNCAVSGTISNTFSTGGIVGIATMGTDIYECINEANITCKKWVCGGIAGELGDGSRLIACGNKGNIDVVDSIANGIGGIVGTLNGYDARSAVYASWTCAVDEIDGNGSLLMGDWDGIGYIDNSYSAPEVCAAYSYEKKENVTEDSINSLNVAMQDIWQVNSTWIWEEGEYPKLNCTTHEWRYTKSEDNKRIEAHCVRNCAEADGGSVTIILPENLIYNGEPCEAEVIENNWRGESPISISYSKEEDSISTASAPVEVGNYTASITVGGETIFAEYTIAYLPTPAPAYEVVGAYQDDDVYWLKDGVAATVSAPSGYQLSISRDGTYGENISFQADGAEKAIWLMKADGTECKTDKIVLTDVLKWDGTAPTGRISINTADIWETLLTNLGFVKFFDAEQRISISAEDADSGLKSIEYYVADDLPGDNTESGIRNFVETITDWKIYEEAVTLPLESKNVVYARLTDNVGNVSYISSEGIVLYTESSLAEKVSRKYKAGGGLRVDITYNGNALESVCCGETELVQGTEYHVDPGASQYQGDGHVMLDASWLDTLEAGTYSLTFIFAPQGVQTTEVSLTKEVELTIEKAPLTIIGASADNRDYNGKNTVTITKIETSGAKGTDTPMVDISKVIGTLSGVNAGSYMDVTLSGLDVQGILTGVGAENYTLVIPDKPVGLITDVKINQIQPNTDSFTEIKSYVYAVDSTETIDLSEFLPNDCGGLDSYIWPEVAGDITVAEDSMVYDGMTFSYMVEKGMVGDTGRMDLILNSKNYTPVYLTIEIELMDKHEVTAEKDVTLKSNVLYVGEALSKLEFNDVKFFADGREIEGTLAWKDASVVPVPGTTKADWVFTPKNTDLYQTLTGTAAIGVYEAPHIQGEDGKQGWDVVKAAVADAKTGDTVKVDMNGASVVLGDVIEDIKGQDITIRFDMGNGIAWNINGKDVTAETIADIDMAVTVSTETYPLNLIPVSVLNTVTGEKQHIEINLAHNGEFGFKAVLSINLEAKNAGLFANLYYYNVVKAVMDFMCADEIAANGVTDLIFTHASDYSIVIDEKPADAKDEDTEDTAGGDSNNEANSGGNGTNSDNADTGNSGTGSTDTDNTGNGGFSDSQEKPQAPDTGDKSMVFVWMLFAAAFIVIAKKLKTSFLR